jgi:nitrate/nitrite transporter NarK
LTLNFIGSMFGFILGILSDKYGRNRIVQAMLFINLAIVLLHVLVLRTLNSSTEVQQILFGALRLFIGFTCNYYTVAMVLCKKLKKTSTFFLFFLYSKAILFPL